MDDEQKAIEGYKILNSINDWVTKCFTVAWGTIPSKITMGDRRIVEQLLKDTDNDQQIVRDAFLEARAQKKESLAYVREIVKNSYQKKITQKNITEGEKIKKEDEKTWNPKTDGSLLESIFGNVEKIAENMDMESKNDTPEKPMSKMRFLRLYGSGRINEYKDYLNKFKELK